MGIVVGNFVISSILQQLLQKLGAATLLVVEETQDVEYKPRP
jgi:hypothetical protein